MDNEEIKKLIDLIRDTDITELHVERDGSSCTIKREKYAYTTGQIPPPVYPHVETGRKEEGPSEEEERLVTISSPIVGIFHRSPSPESPPYVEVGSVVKKGQVLCIVEAMKLMNEIESDTNGTIVKILVENGQAVEYGEPLFLLEPSI